MKEATGEVSGTVITIVLIAAVLAVGVAIFRPRNGEASPAQKWIEEKLFNVGTDED